jgi:hypothetical protein
LRIAVLDLTPESEGNAIGLGLADFCTSRAVRKMDRQVTYRNVITSQNPVAGKIPMEFENDRLVLSETIASLGTQLRRELRMIRIVDTLSLERVQISEALVDEVRHFPQVETIGPVREFDFNRDGNLLPLDQV